MNLQAQLFFHKNSSKIFFVLFIFVFLLQINFWLKTEYIKPTYEVVPPAPSHNFLSATSFGDKEFLFRALAFRLQNSGDVYAGGMISLKDYNYSHLYDWLKALDSLNSKSNLMPSLASYYFSQSQNKLDSTYVVRYLEEHASANLDVKWWWIFQAINIARDDLRDNDLALRLAYKLAENNSKDAPLWTKQMPAFIYAKQGEGCMAFKVIKSLIAENASGKRQISAEEMNFMHYFIETRLKKLKNQNFDPRKCQN